MSTLLGMQLNGRYRLDAQVGAGGMSTVYRAFDTVLERRVAIKLMHREFAADSDQLERFRRESRAVAQLSHPHVVGVIDAGEDEGHPFIVFEYVEGETLKERIRRLGALPVGEAIAYAIEIARALAFAHQRGIVHRDIKPQNVLIDEEGLTADGRVLGTTDYVSPEQALGQDVNGQSDLYSLGIVLFEMLTADVPFHGDNQVAVAMKHVREALPDVQVLRPEVSANLARVLDRLTDKDLGRRYPDARTAERDLEEALATEAARTGQATGEATAVLRTLPPEARRRLPPRLRWQVPLAGMVLIGAAVAIVFAFVLKEGVERTQRGTGAGNIEPERGTRVVSVKRTSAEDYDPLGTGGEHADEASFVVDREKDTLWTTETYRGGELGKDGVGIYVDASPRVRATALQIETARPGWRAQILAARSGPPEAIEGWTRVGGGRVGKRTQRFRLDTEGRAYRYYLVWITALPPGSGRVEIDEIALFAPE